jgi:heme-degrading monooxygenase HmoA
MRGGDAMRQGGLDPETSFEDQLAADTGPVVVVTTFLVPEGRMDEVVRNWQRDGDVMKGAPGYISAQLHRGVGASNLLMNVAVWESTAALAAAFADPAFQGEGRRYPAGVRVLPHVYRKVAVPGVCVA